MDLSRLKKIVLVLDELHKLGLSDESLNKIIDELLFSSKPVMEKYTPDYNENYSSNLRHKHTEDATIGGKCYRLFRSGNKWSAGSIIHQKSGIKDYQYGIPGMFKCGKHFYVLDKYVTKV